MDCSILVHRAVGHWTKQAVMGSVTKHGRTTVVSATQAILLRPCATIVSPKMSHRIPQLTPLTFHIAKIINRSKKKSLCVCVRRAHAGS